MPNTPLSAPSLLAASLWLAVSASGAPPRALPSQGRPAPAPAPRSAAAPAPAIPASPAQLPPVATAAGDTILPPPQIEWKAIAELPAPPGFESQTGVAGAFAGSQDKILLIAGGANYAAGQAWTEAPKAYWNKIYVLEKTPSEDGNHRYAWRDARAELPAEVAYGACVTLPEGVLCIGGRNVDRCFAECRLLHWNAGEKRVEITDFPSLPQPLSNASAVKLGDTVYVIGGRELSLGRATNTFLALDLTKKADANAFVWQKLPSWDGPPRLNALAAAGTDGETESLYLCGGRNPGGADDFLTDLHRYDPVKKTWSMLGNALDATGNAATLMAAPAFFVPPHHLVVVGGTDQKLIELMESNSRRISNSDPEEAEDRRKLSSVLMENFPGYSRNVMAFDIVASEWILLGTFPERPPVANPVVYWDGGMIIPGGETGPGRRTNKIWLASVKKKARIVE